MAQAPFNAAHSARPEETATDPDIIRFPNTAELENRPRSDFENSLMGELSCTCGTCKLEPINTCRCDFAAKMRGEVRTQLDELDRSTEATRRAAAETVRSSFVARYGPNVIHPTNLLDPKGHAAGLVVAAIVLSFLAVILLVLRSIRRRGRIRRGQIDN